MRRPNKEVKIADIRLNRHLVHQVVLREDHDALAQIHPNVNNISRVELPSLNRVITTTLGCEL